MNVTRLASGLPGQVEQEVALALTAGPGLRKGAEAGGPWWGGPCGWLESTAVWQTDMGHSFTGRSIPQAFRVEFRYGVWIKKPRRLLHP